MPVWLWLTSIWWIWIFYCLEGRTLDYSVMIEDIFLDLNFNEWSLKCLDFVVSCLKRTFCWRGVLILSQSIVIFLIQGEFVCLRMTNLPVSFKSVCILSCSTTQWMPTHLCSSNFVYSLYSRFDHTVDAISPELRHLVKPFVSHFMMPS